MDKCRLWTGLYLDLVQKKLGQCQLPSLSYFHGIPEQGISLHFRQQDRIKFDDAICVFNFPAEDGPEGKSQCKAIKEVID
jgi:hypothetical protein